MLDAVHSHARVEIRSLARRAKYRLQRLEATDIYGGDYKFKSLWDEFCHEAQEGNTKSSEVPGVMFSTGR